MPSQSQSQSRSRSSSSSSSPARPRITKTKTKPYPRRTVRQILQGHARDKTLSRDVDALVFLDYVLFMQRLMAHATRKARENDEKRIRAGDLRKVTTRTLREFRG